MCDRKREDKIDKYIGSAVADCSKVTLEVSSGKAGFLYIS